MNFNNKLLIFFQKKYGKKISINSKLFIDLGLDSFELVNLINEIEKKFNKKYKPLKFIDFEKINIERFSKLFK